jgi:hypothetical protein
MGPAKGILLRAENRMTLLWLLLVSLALGCAGHSRGSVKAAPEASALEEAAPQKRKLYSLTADKIWQLEINEGKRFDASGLLLTPAGDLLTVNDKMPELWRIELSDGPTAKLLPTGLLTKQQISSVAPVDRKEFDCEGIAQDASGNLYVSEETDRAIYKINPSSKETERLPIDWAPVKKYFIGDRNASFEGVAIAGDRLYVANERSQPRIIVVDLKTLVILEDYFVDASGFAFGGPHYSDLCAFEGSLFVLDRNHRAVIQVDPKTHAVLAEFGFGVMELQPDVAYRTDFPTGTMEGLAVDKNYFWLVTDNNGKARFNHPGDSRPTLFRCKRPDIAVAR